MIPFSQLITSGTPDEFKAKLYSIADTIGLATRAWQKLSPLRSIFAVLSFLFSAISQAQAAANAGGFLFAATGDWLKARAKEDYNVDFTPAQFAAGNVSVSNSGGGLYTYGAGDLVVLNTGSGKSYANTGAVAVNPLASGVMVPIKALEIGTASNATPGAIDAFVSASPQLTVTNPAPVLGEDEEDEESIRNRCIAKLGSLSPDGPALAYAYVAKTPALNGGVDINRVLVRPAEGNGTIRVVVASPAGVVSGTTGDPTTDLGKVFAALNKLVIPAGYTLLLSSAIAHVVGANTTLYVATSSGLADSDAIAAATTALQGTIEKTPIGGVDVGAGGVVLYRSLEAAMSKSATGILEAKLTVEADTALAATEVAALSSPVITVVQVDA